MGDFGRLADFIPLKTERKVLERHLSYPCIVLSLSRELLPSRVSCYKEGQLWPLATFLEGYP